MSKAVKYLSDWLYPTPESREPVKTFLASLQRYLKADSAVLDIGAGTGSLNPYDFRGSVGRLVGVDVDPRVKDNPLLDEAVIYDGTRLPFEDNTFDVAFSIYVAEHLESPADFLREAARVLKPGGLFAAVTPNRYHYVALIAACTPHWFHDWVNRWRGRQSSDTFPTFYRLNDLEAVRACAARAGLEVVEARWVESRANYLLFAWPAFLLGVLYERLVNSTSLLQRFRVNFLFYLRKPAAANQGE